LVPIELKQSRRGKEKAEETPITEIKRSKKAKREGSPSIFWDRRERIRRREIVVAWQTTT